MRDYLHYLLFLAKMLAALAPLVFIAWLVTR